jgi:hypothetical protein
VTTIVVITVRMYTKRCNNDEDDDGIANI